MTIVEALTTSVDEHRKKRAEAKARQDQAGEVISQVFYELGKALRQLDLREQIVLDGSPGRMKVKCLDTRMELSIRPSGLVEVTYEVKHADRRCVARLEPATLKEQFPDLILHFIRQASADSGVEELPLALT